MTTTILGGGATGLAAAYIAATAGKRVTVIEGSSKLGGLLSTFETAGDRLEFFYHHFFTHDREINWLLKKLGIMSDVLYEPTIMGMFRDGAIYDFTTPFDLLKFKPLSLIDKARFAASSLALSSMPDWRKHEDESALEWFKKWAGKGATDAIWAPMLDIKFGSYGPEVPVAWMSGRLRQRLKSRDKGREKLGYLLGSLEKLVVRLEEELTKLGVRFVMGKKAKALEVEGGRAKTLVLDGDDRGPGERIELDELLVTTPAPVLANLLPASYGAYAEELRRIKYFGAICVVLTMNKPLSHVYWLNVADPGFPFGGVIEHTNFVPPSRYGGNHLAYLSRYIDLGDPLAKEDTTEIGERWVKELPRIYPRFDRARDVVKIQTFRTLGAATVCHRNFSRVVPRCKTPIDKLFITTMAHIYPDERSVNNCIRIAANACDVMGIRHDVPPGVSLSGQVGFD